MSLEADAPRGRPLNVEGGRGTLGGAVLLLYHIVLEVMLTNPLYMQHSALLHNHQLRAVAAHIQ